MPLIKVNSPFVEYVGDKIDSLYTYHTTRAERRGDVVVVTPVKVDFTFRTDCKVPRTGFMMVGWGGNNGSTITGGILANKYGFNWRTPQGVMKPNFFGSMMEASTVSLGFDAFGEIFVPMRDLLPTVKACDLHVDGWDINSADLGEAMRRSQVFHVDLQNQLYEHMRLLKPRPSIYRRDFIAANQESRANNLIPGTLQEQVDQIRVDIRDFKSSNHLDKVIVVWTANTERFCEIIPGVHDTADNLLAAIARDEFEVSPSTAFAVASVLEGCAYLNGSPQNTFVPGVLELAERHGVFVGGDDFKSGQTKVKSVLVDFLVSAGIKPVSIVSYNHLGNNDGKNLSAPQQFHSKQVSKSNVVDDMVSSNNVLYASGERPDHCVVIKYVPYVGDSKRAMDEYISEIFMNGNNTLVLHNTCEDSLLASPIILDLVLLTELCQRITFRVGSDPTFQQFNSVLSLLSYLLKAPLVPQGTPIVNALAKQRSCIENILRATIGLPPINHMLLEYKLSESTEFNIVVNEQLSLKNNNGHQHQLLTTKRPPPTTDQIHMVRQIKTLDKDMDNARCL